MTKLDELFTLDILQSMEGEGYVRRQVHPEFPELAILNYSEKAQFERKWNDVTRQARGLIFNTNTLEVLARPFAKLHNWDETESPKILDWAAPLYSWSNKYDGSLGIVYRRPDGQLAVATRGSFASDQALHATELLLTDQAILDEAAEYMAMGYTPLYEIVYPDNRIVVGYGEMDALVPLGFINIADGSYLPTRTFDVETRRSFKDLIDDLSRTNSEGWVAWASPFKAVKVKQADYIELHRIVTGLNRKAVWRALREGTFRELLELLPDELFKWAEEAAAELMREQAKLYHEVSDWYEAVMISTRREDLDRKGQATVIQRDVPVEYRGMVFTLLDGKTIKDKTWELIEPRGDTK